MKTMDESQSQVQGNDEERPRLHEFLRGRNAYGRGGRNGPRDPRNCPQSPSHCRPAPEPGRKQRHHHRGLQHDGLGRSGRQRYQPDLRDGRGNRDPPDGGRTRLQQRDHLRAPSQRIRLRRILPASILMLAGIFLLSLILFFTSTAEAQEGLAVRKVVFNVTRIDFQDALPHYGANGFLTWLATAPNTTVEWGYIANETFVSLEFVDIEEIPGRTNWLTFNNSFDPPGSLFLALEGENDTVILSIGYDDGSIYTSCIIIVKAIVGTYECGEPGFSTIDTLTHETVAEYPPIMSMQLRHPWTASDALLSNITYEYQSFFGGIWVPLQVNSTTTVDGIVRAWFNTTDWEEGLVATNTFRARVRDQLTHESSPWSCTVQARIGSTELGPYSCIGQQAFFIPDASDAPAFPLMDIPALSSGLGLSQANTALMIGLIFGLVLTIAVGIFGGPVTAVVCAACLVGFLYTVNAIAAFVLTVIFIIATSVVAYKWKENNGGDSK